MRLQRLATSILVSFGLLLSACGGDAGNEPTGRATPSVTPSESPEPSEDASPSPSEETTSLQVWMVQGDTLRPVLRSVPRTQAPARDAVEELLSGPSARESVLGIGSEVPNGVELLDISLSQGVLTVDLSSAFEEGGGSATMRMRLAQLVYTATQFPTVSSMELHLDGSDVDTFSNEGIVLSEPQRPRDYKDLLPAIVVLQPGIDEEVTSPLKISGTANVFEATVSLRLVVGGEEVASGFTTATCGTGCRGAYSGMLAFEVDAETEGVLEVYESSAKDGSPQNVVKVPVLLRP